MTSSRAKALTFGQHLTIVGSRMLLGALTGAIRLTRGAPPEGWRTIRYGLHREEVLDHLPCRAETRHAPVVFFHGGGWMMGDTDTYSHDLLFLADAGYPVFNVEYPKAPEHPHPRILFAVFQALGFIKANFPEAHGVHLMGDSAGGNLAVMAALLTLHPEFLTAVNAGLRVSNLPQVLSVTSIYGVLDRKTCLTGFPGGDTMIESYAGPGALGENVDAAHAITPMDLAFRHHPPCLLLCGDADPLLASQALYAARLQGEGFDVQTWVYPGGIHGFFNFPESAPKAACRKDILAFLNGIPA
jgi:acetyl esterase